eukprot:3828118-Pyramimonas_sp.AAC.1
MLTTDSESSDSDVPLLADAGECAVEILRGEATRKYLGRMFSGDLRRRGQCNLNRPFGLRLDEVPQFSADLAEPEDS